MLGGVDPWGKCQDHGGQFTDPCSVLPCHADHVCWPCMLYAIIEVLGTAVFVFRPISLAT